MRPLPPRWPRRTVVLTTAALAALVLPPTVALAMDGVPAPPGPSEHAEDAEEAAGAATQGGRCEAELTTFTREGVSGEAQAVALTAQAMDRDTDGWLLLAWQAADSTHLTAVLATAPDGTTRHLDPTPTGTVEHVTTLTFCGTHTTPDTTPGPAAPSGTPAPTAPATPGDTTPDTAGSVAASAPARDGERSGQNGSDGSRDDRPRTTRDGDGDAGSNGDAGEEVEVLGVRLVSPLARTRAGADQALGRTGGTAGEEARTLALAGSGRSDAGLHLWLLIAAVGVGLTAAGTLLRARTQPVTATNPATTPDGPEAGR